MRIVQGIAVAAGIFDLTVCAVSMIVKAHIKLRIKDRDALSADKLKVLVILLLFKDNLIELFIIVGAAVVHVLVIGDEIGLHKML